MGHRVDATQYWSFSLEEVGIVDETALTLLEGVLFVKGTLAHVGPSYADLDRSVALANGRVRYPPWALTLSITAGRFLAQDRGVAVDLASFLGIPKSAYFFGTRRMGRLAGCVSVCR